jgi:NADH-quinone oxidoreductase subunit I
MPGNYKTITDQQENNPITGGYIASTLLGLNKTLKYFFRHIVGLDKQATVSFPEETHTYSPRFKGVHYLTKREDDKVRCTACFLCATNCPAKCIHIVAGEEPEQGIEKYPVRFEIDILRCVYCGFCVEACPVDAIRMGPEYSLAGLAEDSQPWILNKEFLLNRGALKYIDQQSVKKENSKIGQ